VLALQPHWRSVDVSAAGAGIVFSHAFVTLWRITPTANAGETITLTVEGQGLFPYVGQDALRVRRATSARDTDCERVSDPTVVDLPFVADGSTPTDLVTFNVTFAASGRLLVCYNASRSIGRRYTLLGAVIVRPVALSLTPSKVEPDEATTLNLVGFGLDARTPRGNVTNYTRGVFVSLTASDSCATPAFIRAATGYAHEVTAARQLLALGDYPGSRPRTLTLCLGGFPDFVPRLRPDVTLRVMARCTGVVVTRHFAELTYAQRPVQVTFLGLGIGDVGVEFTVIAVQDTAASVCRDIPRDYLTQSTSNWTIIRPTTTTLHTADTVVAQFDVQTSGVYTLCWVTNERDHFIPTDSQPAGSEYNFLFVVPDVLRVQPRNGTVLSADGLDNYTLVVDAHGVSRNDTVALSRNACSDVDDLVQYPLLGRNPPLNVSVAGEYTLCFVTPRITPQRIATFSVIAVVKANLTQNAVEQYETATITIRGNGMALAHALWLVPNGQLACPTVLDGASHIVPFSATSPGATEGLRVIRARLPTETAGVFGLCYYQPGTAPQFVAPWRLSH
jgi:hypothetical protein